ncbi:hypothetical protein KY290_036909 [Solanum tuberosum]|uniref:DUF4283 domain-containing protein n=1 Tax=Solanum tuberosum TaxID=4113 RepID=A0ABQ7TU03_SOLTU|nr:hypothetical protein KY290_036909 [Solanum tuberosum]
MGRRAQIPTQKVAEAQESMKQMNHLQKRKGNQGNQGTEGNQVGISQNLTSGEGSAKANEIVSSPKSILKEWNEAIYSPNMSARKSWANEMESENEVRRKPSIWDNFDITKTSNAGFKLNFVSPITQGQIPVCEIDLEDITSEIDYWKNAVVCYVLGAHPPFAVLNGYIRRQWGKFGINNVSMLKNGIVLVRFDTLEGKNEVFDESTNWTHLGLYFDRISVLKCIFYLNI